MRRSLTIACWVSRATLGGWVAAGVTLGAGALLAGCSPPAAKQPVAKTNLQNARRAAQALLSSAPSTPSEEATDPAEHEKWLRQSIALRREVHRQYTAVIAAETRPVNVGPLKMEFAQVWADYQALAEERALSMLPPEKRSSDAFKMGFVSGYREARRKSKQADEVFAPLQACVEEGGSTGRWCETLVEDLQAFERDHAEWLWDCRPVGSRNASQQRVSEVAVAGDQWRVSCANGTILSCPQATGRNPLRVCLAPFFYWAEWELDIAEEHARRGESAEALRHYEAALEQDPSDEHILNEFVWALSTSVDPTLRDGRRAIELAQRLLRVAPDCVECLDTVAAAYAEGGDFARAVELQKLAIAGVRKGEAPASYQAALAAYRRRVARREAPGRSPKK